MQAHYDVVILGGGLAGLTLARQLRQERPSLRVLVLEKRTHPAPEAAHKVGESSVEIGAHYFGQVLGLDPHMADQPAAEIRHPLLLRRRREPRPAAPLRAGAAAVPARPELPARSRPARELPVRGRSAPGLRRPRSRRHHRRRPGRPASHRPLHAGRRTAPRHLPLGRRRHRPARLPEGQVRPAPPEPAQGQRHVVARRQAAEARRLDVRRRLAGPRRHRQPLAQHEPPDGAGLLGVVHPARVGLDQRRHRRRRRDASVPDDQPVGQVVRLARRARAAGRRGLPRSRRPGRRLPRAQPLPARLRPRLLERALGADRRGRRLHRSVLFAGLGLHRRSATT